MIIVQLLIVSAMAGCWGFLWNLFTENTLKKSTLNVNLKKPLGACLVCTSAWWCMLIFIPLYLLICNYSFQWLYLFPIYGGVSASISIVINNISVSTILKKEQQNLIVSEQIKNLTQKAKPTFEKH